jgi:hypothetical protein
VAESLYVTFGEPVAKEGGGPGTIRTNAVETIDNDHALDALRLLSDPEPNPGTRITETVETVDDDEAMALLALLSSDPDPRPQPGTTLTATVETTDEDASSILSQLS